MRNKVLRFCREQALFQAGDHVVCAVSGGADSMAMLVCLCALQEALGITVSAAHFNHRLRGAASDGDETFVRAFCAARGIPFSAGGGDVAARAGADHSSIEEAARALRYAFLLRQPGKIATAHTADDNAETVLLNLTRGTGLRGLCGIPVRRDRIVRPLLCVTRDEILAFLSETGTPWREDTSNAGDDYRRNRIRHGVIPLLKAENPALAETILRQSLLLRAEDARLDAEAAEAAEAALRGGSYDCAAICALPEALERRVILRLLQTYNAADARHVEAVRQLLRSPSPTGRTGLAHGLQAVKSYGLLQIEGRRLPPLGEYRLPVPGSVYLPELSLEVRCFFLENSEVFSGSDDTILLNCDMMGAELTVRSRRTGDVLALPGGHRTLKRLMIDRKIPAAERDRLPVLATETAVAAVRGLGAGREFLPAAGRPVLAVQFQNR